MKRTLLITVAAFVGAGCSTAADPPESLSDEAFADAVRYCQERVGVDFDCAGMVVDFEDDQGCTTAREALAAIDEIISVAGEFSDDLAGEVATARIAQVCSQPEDFATDVEYCEALVHADCHDLFEIWEKQRGCSDPDEKRAAAEAWNAVIAQTEPGREYENQLASAANRACNRPEEFTDPTEYCEAVTPQQDCEELIPLVENSSGCSDPDQLMAVFDDLIEGFDEVVDETGGEPDAADAAGVISAISGRC